MKTTKRFDEAVSKLYNAFHDGTLNAMDCEACAVGNICNNNGHWDDLPVFQSTVKWGNDMEPSQLQLKKAKRVIKESGYSEKELIEIEIIFLKSCEFSKGTKEQQFNGLCAVVEYLCELDNIPNVWITKNYLNKKKINLNTN
jgi:hypothetical protein